MSRGSFILALIKQDGSLWITGQGAGTVASDHVAGSVLDPVRIGNDNHWQEAVGGESSLLVRHRDGSWWALGENQMGLLGFPRSTKLGTPQRLRFQLDLWAWSANGETTLFLTRDGGIYYLGRTPGPRALTGLAGVKNVINREVSRVGIPPPFSGLGDSWTDRPVRIGELPAGVTSGL